MEFFYFGITFFHFKKRIDISPRKQMLSFQMFKEEVSGEMAAIIRKDVSELNASDLGDKSGYPSNGKFVRMDRDVFVYHHTQHASCSKVKLSSTSIFESISYGEQEVPSCEDPTHHYSLWPFYDSNEQVLKRYKKILAGIGTDTNPSIKSDIQSEIEQLEQIVNNTAPPIGSNVFPDRYTFNWSENDWTKRLVGGVQKLFPDRKVEFTAEWGLTWSTSLLGLLGVGECLGTPGHFLFTGSPDIVIGKRQCVSTSHTTDSEEDSSSSDELMDHNMVILFTITV